MSKYNGHKNWNHWNVSLWLNNDEIAYEDMRLCIRTTKNRDEAANKMYYIIRNEYGQHQTPDGAPYSRTSIKAAMVGLS